MGFDVDLFSEMPCDLDGPTFSAPWEAQAFAMAVRLHEAGVFEWTEWAVVLSSEIERAQRIVSAFEAAQVRGDGRVELDGLLVETPIYRNARQLLKRAKELGVI